jgi:hypothetical protein
MQSADKFSAAILNLSASGCVPIFAERVDTQPLSSRIMPGSMDILEISGLLETLRTSGAPACVCVCACLQSTLLIVDPEEFVNIKLWMLNVMVTNRKVHRWLPLVANNIIQRLGTPLVLVETANNHIPIIEHVACRWV